MIGYQIFEIQNLDGMKPNGIKPYVEKIGILDFIRELRQEDLRIKKFYNVQVYGIDEVLYHCNAEKNIEILSYIKKYLVKAAKELQRKLAQIQIICKGKLVLGQNLTLTYRSKKLPIDLIFGSPIVSRDEHNNEFYRANFNLTS